MTVSFWQDRAKWNLEQRIIEKDIIVIGGGISGLATAYWLAKEDPSLSVAVVEKHHIGDGATGRSAGFITCGSVEHFNRLVHTRGRETGVEIWKFSEENLRLLKEEIIKGDDKDCIFEHKGSFSLASTQAEFKELQETAELMSQFNINVELVQEKQIEQRLSAVGFVGGVKYVDDASIDPQLMLDLIRKRIGEFKNGVEFFEHNEVYEVGTEADLKVVKTNKHHFKAPMVVYATNGYSPLLNEYFQDKNVPTRGQILALEPTELFMESPCYANFVLDYFRQMPTGEVLIGGFRQLQKDAEVGYSDQTTDIIQDALEKFLEDHIPVVKGKRITHRWSGIMGFNSDGQPMVGALPTDPQLYFVGGYTCHGIGTGFHAGKALVDSLFDRPIPEFISARRFT